MDWNVYFLQGIELLFLGIGAYYDLKNKELPMSFLMIFLMISLFCNIILQYQSLSDFLIGGSIGSVFLGAGWLTKEEIGYGDGIGIVILGIMKGWKGLIPVIFTAFLLSGIYGLWRLIGFKEPGNSTMPFFPFLFIASIGVILL